MLDERLVLQMPDAWLNDVSCRRRTVRFMPPATDTCERELFLLSAQ